MRRERAAGVGVMLAKRLTVPDRFLYMNGHSPDAVMRTQCQCNPSEPRYLLSGEQKVIRC